MSILRKLLLLATLAAPGAHAQSSLEPWGNLSGIRVQGQLVPFTTSLRVVSGDGTRIVSTAKERQKPRYERRDGRQYVTTRIDSLYFTETAEDLEEGHSRIYITCYAAADQHLEGIYFSLQVPADSKNADTIRYEAGVLGARTLAAGTPIQINLPIHQGDAALGDSIKATIDLYVKTTIDRTPVHLKVNPDQPGRVFDGVGGNFRLQNPRDPKVIDYNLTHLRVAWGRVELPWRSWQPTPDSTQVNDPHVQQSMRMAAGLGKLGIPLILSAWFPPDWAILGPYKAQPGVDGVWGNALNPDKMQDIYRSLADYIVYLKDDLSTEIKFFSFNESDLGINVRMTPRQHDEFIKGFGAYLRGRGLKTKLLLGDNSDATTWAFIQPALEDTAALPYIGAVSFHSWRGWDTATLRHWADAATRLHLPLIVAEGSIDAAAWAYPAVFEEPTYALKEIALYTRLMAICQPLSILQWQLTRDYSLLTDNGTPTQRFWNLRQLAAVPAGLNAIPISADRPGIASAALGAKGNIALHVVNDGATREAVIEGLPATVKTLQVYVTNALKSMDAAATVKVANGKASVTLPADSFVTLVTPRLIPAP